mgnify:CR=1 FL=1
MSLLDKMPMEELFAYDPNRAGDSIDMVNQAERECVRAIVDQELSLHLDKVQVPNELLPLFNDAWKEVLTEIYLEDGFGSIRWILAMEITDELLWTLQPKSNMSERTKMIGMLPTLVKVLRQGLNSVNWDRQSADNMFSSLSQYHMTLLRGGAEKRARAPAPKPRPTPAKEKTVKPSHDIELLDGLDDQALPLEANHHGEKGWFFRPDTNEWVYQGDEGVERVEGSSSNNAVRKIGRGDH